MEWQDERDFNLQVQRDQRIEEEREVGDPFGVKVPLAGIMWEKLIERLASQGKILEDFNDDPRGLRVEMLRMEQDMFLQRCEEDDAMRRRLGIGG